jgi:hypothetical protein
MAAQLGRELPCVLRERARVRPRLCALQPVRDGLLPESYHLWSLVRGRLVRQLLRQLVRPERALARRQPRAALE